MKDFKFIFEKWVLQKHRPTYEESVKKNLKHIYGSLFIDIGARDGLYCRLLKNNFDEIISFEPNPSKSFTPTYNTALSNYDADNQDFYLNTGIGSADTLLKEFDYHPNPIDHTVKPQIFKTSNIIKVNVRRFDTIFGKREVDLVKIDVEGSELDVLDGMKNSLQNNRIRNLMIELHNINNQNKLFEIMNDFKANKLDNHPRYLFHKELD